MEVISWIGALCWNDLCLLWQKGKIMVHGHELNVTEQLEEYMNCSTVGERIAFELKRQNKTKYWLMKITGIKHERITRCINGEYNFRKEGLKLIGYALGVSPEYLNGRISTPELIMLMEVRL